MNRIPYIFWGMNALARKTVLAVALCGALLCARAGDGVKLYMGAESLPNALEFLPPPPDTASAAFAYDLARHEWGKSMRADSARAALAAAQATVDVAEMAALFSGPFGMEISEKETPAIMKALKRGVLTMRLAARAPKARYMRTRPYVRFGEPTLVPADEEVLRNTGSFPSGHTVRGWAMALLLAEINPAAQNALLKYGYEWGQSRVIAGFHWQSDVDASKTIVAGCFARLHADPAFDADMRKARAEFARLSAKRGGKAKKTE